MAQEWAQQCIFDHGQQDRDPMPYATIGQNLYVKTSTCQFSVTVAPVSVHFYFTNVKAELSAFTFDVQCTVVRSTSVVFSPLGKVILQQFAENSIYHLTLLH